MKDRKSTKLSEAITRLDEIQVMEILKRNIEEGVLPLRILDELSAGMEEVGRLYRQGEYFLSELIFSGDIFRNAMDRLKPLLGSSYDRAAGGMLVMGTVKDDIHDLGKSIVIMLLECAGFEVVDLGVDVPAEKFVEAIRKHDVGLVGLSALLTTAFDSMHATIEAVRKAGLRDRVRIMIGGGSTSEAWRKQIGADFYGKDATSAVEIAKRVLIEGK